MRVSVAIERALVAVAIGAVGLLATAGPAVATPSVPYTDSNADAYLGICNQQGQQITSGSIDTVPFAWEVVSSAPAPSPVSGKGRTATLYAYQPIENVEPGDWSGEQITGTSEYSNPSYPMAVSTDRDFALSQFLEVFPPRWDGFIELRMFLGAPGAEPQALTYPALSLYISGDTWQAVGGGSVDCTGGRAVSNEMLLPTTTIANRVSGSQASSSSSTSTTPDGRDPRSRHDISGARSGGVTASPKVLAGRSASKSSNVGLVVGLIVLGLLMISFASWTLVRDRRRRSGG